MQAALEGFKFIGLYIQVVMTDRCSYMQAALKGFKFIGLYRQVRPDKEAFVDSVDEIKRQGVCHC